MGVSIAIGVYGVVRSGEGEGVPTVPLLGYHDLYGRRLVLGVLRVQITPKTVLSRKSTARRNSSASGSTCLVRLSVDPSPPSASWLLTKRRALGRLSVDPSSPSASWLLTKRRAPGSSLCGSFSTLCLMATCQAQSPWFVSLWILLHPLPHGYLPSAEPLGRLSVDPSPPSASWLLAKRRAPGSSLCGSFSALCLMATCQAQSPWFVSLWILLHPLPHGYFPSAEPLVRFSVDPSPPSASWLLAKRRAPGLSLCGSFSTLCLMATSQAQSPWFVFLWILLHPLPHGYFPSAEPLGRLSVDPSPPSASWLLPKRRAPGSSLCGSFSTLCLMATCQAQSPWFVSLWILLYPLPHGYFPSAEPLVRFSVDPSPPSASWLLPKRRAPGSSLCGSFSTLCLMATSQAQSPWFVSLWILLHPLPHGYLPSAEPLVCLSVDPSPPSASWLLPKRRAPGSSLCGSFSTLCIMATSQAQSPWVVSLWILLHPLPHGYFPSAEPLVRLSVDPSPPSASWLLAKRRAPGSSLCGSFSTLCLMATSQAQSPWFVSLWILLHPLPHGYFPSAEPLVRLSVDPSPPSASWLLPKRRAPGSSLCGSFSTLCLMATCQAQSPWFVSLWILLHPLPHGYFPSAEPLVRFSVDPSPPSASWLLPKRRAPGSSLCGSFSTLCLMATSQAQSPWVVSLWILLHPLPHGYFPSAEPLVRLSVDPSPLSASWLLAKRRAPGSSLCGSFSTLCLMATSQAQSPWFVSLWILLHPLPHGYFPSPW